MDREQGAGQGRARKRCLFGQGTIRQLHSQDIARAIRHGVTQPPRVAVDQVLVRLTDHER